MRNRRGEFASTTFDALPLAGTSTKWTNGKRLIDNGFGDNWTICNFQWTLLFFFVSEFRPEKVLHSWRYFRSVAGVLSDVLILPKAFCLILLF